MKYLLLILIIFPVFVFSQVDDDFSDGDFSQDPAWGGDTSAFRISSSSAVPEEFRPALQLYSEGADTSYLVTGNYYFEKMQWNCWVKLSFNSSSNNNARIYLVSDLSDLEGPLHAYYLQLGGTVDSIWFCRQDGPDHVPLLKFENAFTGNSTNMLNIKVIRDENGYWEFYCDPSGGNGLLFEGEIVDTTYKSNDYFGIFCKYSSSNSTKFYFDNIYAGPLIVDSIPPLLEKVSIISPSELRLYFSENLDEGLLTDVSHYYLDGGIGNPELAEAYESNSVIRLIFSSFLEEGKSYLLTISGLSDPAGNTMQNTEKQICYYNPQPYDVLINEIMADPVPSAGLPEYEYLELFNNSLYPIDLESWTLLCGNTEHLLPAFTMEAGSYLLLAEDEQVWILNGYQPVIGLSSFGLSNSGQRLTLLDKEGNVISTVEYSPEWYGGGEKAEGGWSLELADPWHPCVDEGNWSVSTDPSGGSPGRANSQLRELDFECGIERICCLDEQSIQVTFTAKMDSLDILAAAKYHFGNGPGGIQDISAFPPDYKTVLISFEEEMLPGIEYGLEVDAAVRDCRGTESGLMQSRFGLASEAVAFDLVINEILFNPLGEGEDYVEIYNRSDKIIELGDIYIASVHETPPNPPDTNKSMIAEDCFPIFPGHYLVLTKDPAMVQEQYYKCDPEAMLKTTLTAFNNDAGRALLLDKSGNVIDGMTYTEEMHYPLLHSVEGVALEKLNYDRLGDDPLNWHSASESSGFGTPGLQNSQFIGGNAAGQNLEIDPEVFSPNGDGKNDLVSICCSFTEAGRQGSILVFDAGGSLVRTLVNNRLFGTSETFYWDGLDDNHNRMVEGVYVIYLEVFDLEGNNFRAKKAVGVGGK